GRWFGLGCFLYAAVTAARAAAGGRGGRAVLASDGCSNGGRGSRLCCRSGCRGGRRRCSFGGLLYAAVTAARAAADGRRRGTVFAGGRIRRVGGLSRQPQHENHQGCCN